MKLLVAIILLYNLYACVAMRIPPVHGTILDRDTGQPIEGVEVWRQGGSDPALFFWAEHGIGWAEAFTVSDSRGKFFFPSVNARFAERDSVWLDFLWPFQWIDEVNLAGYHKAYVSFSAGGHGLWKSNCATGHADALLLVSISRMRIPVLGLYYTIKLSKPKTQQQWLAKIHSLPGTGDSGHENRWRFADLTGYLERWPDTPYSSAEVPFILSDYARPDYNGNNWHLDCAKLKAASVAERDAFVSEFAFLGSWFAKKLLEVEAATRALNRTQVLSPTEHEHLLSDYSEWQRFAKELDSCIGGKP